MSIHFLFICFLVKKSVIGGCFRFLVIRGSFSTGTVAGRARGKARETSVADSTSSSTTVSSGSSGSRIGSPVS